MKSFEVIHCKDNDWNICREGKILFGIREISPTKFYVGDQRISTNENENENVNENINIFPTLSSAMCFICDTLMKN